MAELTLETRVQGRLIQSGAIVGGACAAVLLGIAGSYVGDGIGYVVGHVMDALPLARDFAPMLAERSGLLAQAADHTRFNVDFYQTVGAGVGVLSGIALPAGYLTYKLPRLGP